MPEFAYTFFILSYSYRASKIADLDTRRRETILVVPATPRSFFVLMNTASKLGPHTQTDQGTFPGVGL
jgi:hypothetical protein